MRIFTLTITDEDSVVLDSIEVSEEELRQAQTNSLAALSILEDLSVGVK